MVALQAPLFKEFSRQEYWSGLPFPSPRDLPKPGIEPGSPTLQADSLPSEPPAMPPPPTANTITYPPVTESYISTSLILRTTLSGRLILSPHLQTRKLKPREVNIPAQDYPAKSEVEPEFELMKSDPGSRLLPALHCLSHFSSYPCTNSDTSVFLFPHFAFKESKLPYLSLTLSLLPDPKFCPPTPTSFHG